MADAHPNAVRRIAWAAIVVACSVQQANSASELHPSFFTLHPFLPAGSISGSIEPKGQASAVAAIDRSSGKRFTGTIDAAGGAFRVEGLSAGATYDLVIDFKGGRLEGVNMKVPRSDYEEEQPLSEEDIATIKAKVLGLNKFEDVVEIMAIDGNIQHAAILVNKLRTKPFYASKPGEVIWRPELWHFERPDDTWVKVQDELFVILYRERIQKADFDKKSHTFDSSLGGFAIDDKKAAHDVGTIKLPAATSGVRYRGVGLQPKPEPEKER
jgi:hypothetical protein